MDSFILSGALDLPWWAIAIVALGLTHVTIVAVTIFLHRHQTHHALDMHPVIKEASKPETLERYGHGAPDDWLERNLYSRHPIVGLVLMGVIDFVLSGAVPGALVRVTLSLRCAGEVHAVAQARLCR